MADLIVIGHPDETTADAAADEARRLAADLIIQPDAIAVITRDADGTYHATPVITRSVAGRLGMFWGFLVGLLFFIPVFGMAIGAGMGAPTGKFAKTSIDKQFQDQVRGMLQPGPFTDDSSSAFVCPLSQGGAIDPSVFVASNGPWLLWKSDGDCCNMPTTIYSQASGRRALSRRSCTPAHRGVAELGGESGRGTVDDPERQHLLALLLGQHVGNGQLRHRCGEL